MTTWSYYPCPKCGATDRVCEIDGGCPVKRCEVYGCKAGSHEPDELRAIPLPGEQVYHRTVIASDGDGTSATLLLLASKSMRDPAFRYRYNYEVSRLDLRPHGNLTQLSDHLNIVPAVREYEAVTA